MARLKNLIPHALHNMAMHLGKTTPDRLSKLRLPREISLPIPEIWSRMFIPERDPEFLIENGFLEKIDGIDNIVETQKRIAKNYFKDGCIDIACPPLKALLHLMVDGIYEGKTITNPEIRNLFTRESLLASDWYAARLDAKVIVEKNLVAKKITALEEFQKLASHETEGNRLHITEKLEASKKRQEKLESPTYRESLIGTIGTDPALIRLS